jgi:hypothetical protein
MSRAAGATRRIAESRRGAAVAPHPVTASRIRGMREFLSRWLWKLVIGPLITLDLWLHNPAD